MRQKTRGKKIQENFPKEVKDKFLPEDHIPALQTLGSSQKTLLRFLKEGRAIVFAKGSAGCGKSYVTAYHCSSLLKQRKVEQIVLVRANVSVGKSLGMLPGTLEEKLLPFFQQTIAHLKKFLGEGQTSYFLEKKIINMQSIEHMRGMSIENSAVIIEEAQNLTKEEFEMILSRIGEGTQLIFTGDEKQTDLKGVTGLSYTIEMLQRALQDQPDYLEDEDLYAIEENIGIVNFTPNDVVRSGICKTLVKLYYYQGE